MNYSFSIEHANQYGVDEAIMLHNFIYWISKNMASNKHQHDEKTWSYNSYQAFSALFPFWSRRQIERILKSLIKQNVLVTGNYNRSSYDRTIWYAFVNEDLFLGHVKASKPIDLPPLHQTVKSKNANGEMDIRKPDNGNTQTVTPIPNINTDQKQNNNNLVDDDNFEKIFSTEEQPAAKKVLSKIPTQKQVEVLAVLLVKIKTSTIKNKGSYLRSMVNSVIEGTFTPLSPKKSNIKPKVKEIWEKQGFKSQKEYDQPMLDKTLTK
jgi:hypothetical protein